MAYSISKESHLFLLNLCLFFSFLIQIGTNLANDYYDFIKGADTRRVNAPKRSATSGAIKPIIIRNASFLCLILAFVTGFFALRLSGGSDVIIFIGIGSVICALIYTCGPFPLAYNGLGDVFVILAFGFVAIETTSYLLLTASGIIWLASFWTSLGVGCIINCILVVNNYRDYEDDRIVSKNTLIVLLGKKFGKFLFLVCLMTSTIFCPLFDENLRFCILVFPLGVAVFYKMVKAVNNTGYAQALALSSLCVLLYGFAACFGILTDKYFLY